MQSASDCFYCEIFAAWSHGPGVVLGFVYDPFLARYPVRDFMVRRNASSWSRSYFSVCLSLAWPATLRRSSLLAPDLPPSVTPPARMSRHHMPTGIPAASKSAFQASRKVERHLDAGGVFGLRRLDGQDQVFVDRRPHGADPLLAIADDRARLLVVQWQPFAEKVEFAAGGVIDQCIE